MANIYSMSDTWNDAGTTFTGIGLNVTDTASASGSLLMDLQVGGTSIFKVGKGLTSPAVSIGAAALRDEGSGQFSVNRLFYFNSVSLGLNNRALAFGAAFGTYDTYLHRDAANTLAQRNGTTAQTFNIYNTYDSSTIYERGFMKWDTNVLKIGTEKAGTGTARALELQTDGTTRLTIASNGNVSAAGNLQGVDVRCTNSFQRNSIFALYSSVANRIVLSDATSFNTFDLLQFGGVTSSYPAIKRSTTSLQARLADDSAFTNIQGKLTTETAYTAGAPTATGYIVLYDSTGTAYKVPAEAL